MNRSDTKSFTIIISAKHAICERRRSSDNIANNKIVCNHAKYIVDIAKNYLVGNPVAYSCSDGYDIEAVKNCFAVQDMPSLDAEFEKTMSIFGKAYELVYADEQSQPKSVCLPPSNTFIVYGAGVWRNSAVRHTLLQKA